MALLSLPRELLLLIATFLTRDTDLAHLVLTHPIFEQFLNRALYMRNQRNATGGNVRVSGNIRYEFVLFWALKRNRLATAERAIRLGLDVNLRFHKEYSLLRGACQIGRLEFVRLLLKTDRVDDDLSVRGINAPFFQAASHGHVEVLGLLLNYIRQRVLVAPEAARLIDVNSPDRFLRTPLAMAVISGHAETVNFLLSVEDIDAYRPCTRGYSPFSAACDNGNQQIVKAMLASGKVDPNLVDGRNITPLNWCLALDDTDAIVRILLASGKLDIHKRADRSVGLVRQMATPFEIACMAMKKEAMMMLLDAGMDPMLRGCHGRTPLHLAVEYRHQAIVSKLLAMGGVDVNAKDDNGDTPLHAIGGQNRAPTEHDRAVIRLLLETPGIDYNAVNNLGRSPMYSSIFFANQDHITELLVDMTDIDPITAVCPASKYPPILLAVELRSWPAVIFFSNRYNVSETKLQAWYSDGTPQGLLELQGNDVSGRSS